MKATPALVRLSHQASAGLASQSSRTGEARTNTSGLNDNRPTSSSASAGATHRFRYKPFRSLTLVRSTSREGLHCSNRRLLTNIRQRVRTTASRL
ncbi:hypothetical protein D3C77_430470 [compost metagenome]